MVISGFAKTLKIFRIVLLMGIIIPDTHKTTKNPEDSIHFFVNSMVIIRSALIINNTIMGVIINDNQDKIIKVFDFNFTKLSLFSARIGKSTFTIMELVVFSGSCSN